MLHPWQARIRGADLVRRHGMVTRLRSTYVEANGPAVPLGTLCRLIDPDGTRARLAQVIGVDRACITLAPFEDLAGTAPGGQVIALPTSHDVAVGDALLGRVIDPLGRPLDSGPAPAGKERGVLHAAGPAPLERASPRKVLETGIRAIDGLLTLAHGQRVGIFAAAGVGKTSLMQQLAAQVDADRIVLALIGERGREVESIWSGIPAAVRRRTVLVAATSDQPAILRARAADYAMALAEHWRTRGCHVLLLLDSVTRLAMALREIGLAAGEPPTVRAYTPNVFAALPRLIERAGALRAGGAISAVLTVLAETDDLDDPICETLKSLLDGHFVLSRTLAEQGHFPAIDVSRSVSRQALAVTPGSARRDAQAISAWLDAFEQSRTLRQAGLYAAGSDAQIDQAVARHAEIVAFLRQAPDQKVPLEETLADMRLVVEKAR